MDSIVESGLGVPLGLKDSSREFRLNYVINFIFYLYLMLHVCVQRFDVTRNFENFCKILETKQALK